MQCFSLGLSNNHSLKKNTSSRISERVPICRLCIIEQIMTCDKSTLERKRGNDFCSSTKKRDEMCLSLVVSRI